MTFLITILVPAFVLLISTTSNAAPENDLIQTYFEKLKLKNYNSDIPPVGNGGQGRPVHVLSTMYLIDVHKIDDFNMEYRASFYFRQSWNDTRLAYEDMDISSIILQAEKIIWTPDLFFVQEKEGIKHSIISPNVFIKILPNGEVKYSVRVSVTFSCPMDFNRFPHDIHKCVFSIESYGRTRDQLYLDWDTRNKIHSPVSKTDEINVLPFELSAIENSVRNVSLTFGVFRRLDVSLTFKRKIGFFMTRLYIPFIILVSLSWLSFWIKLKMATFRISLLLVIMYLMINIGSDISSYIPPAPYTKASDLWIAVCDTLVFAAFLEFIFVSIIARSEKKRYPNDPEASIIVESEGKEKILDSGRMAVKMVASRLSKERRISYRVDKMASIVFPILFIVFNFLYWLVY